MLRFCFSLALAWEPIIILIRNGLTASGKPVNGKGAGSNRYQNHRHLRVGEDTGEGDVREGEGSDPHKDRGESGSKDPRKGEDRGCGGCGASFAGNPYPQADPAPKHHPTLRNHRDPKTTFPHHGVHGGRRALRLYRQVQKVRHSNPESPSPKLARFSNRSSEEFSTSTN